MQTTTQVKRRTRKQAPAVLQTSEALDAQMPLPVDNVVRPPALAPLTFVLTLSDTVAEVDLLGQGLLPIEPGLALKRGAKVIRFKQDAVQKATPAMQSGMRTKDLHEYFLSAGDVGIAGILLIKRKEDGWSATLSKTLLPYVLSDTAVKAGDIPPPGQSALPTSVERCIPARLQYWKRTTPEEITQTRDMLVESGMFNERLLKLVDGEIRLCVEQLFLYEPEGDTPPPAAKSVSLSAAIDSLLPPGKTIVAPLSEEGEYDASLLKAGQDTSNVLVLSPPLGTPDAYIDALVKAAPVAPWLFEYDDTPEGLKALERLGSVFKLDAAPNRIFVSSFDPGDVRWVTRAAAEAPPADDKVLDRAVKRMAHIEKAGAEERYVLGIVLEPETVDAQQDIYSPTEIAQSAHVFMEKYRTVGLMHKGAVNDKVKILESYLAPVDFEVDGVPVKKGTWLMAVRVLDDDLWKAVKDGGLTGFSIGGSAIRKPDPVATTATTAPAGN